MRAAPRNPRRRVGITFVLFRTNKSPRLSSDRQIASFVVVKTIRADFKKARRIARRDGRLRDKPFR